MRAGLLLIAVASLTTSLYGQNGGPAAHLGKPVPVEVTSPLTPSSSSKTVRAAAPDPFKDDPAPAAKLGPVRSEIGTGPAGASREELYNWGTVPNRNREWDLPRPSDRIRRNDDNDRDRDRDRGGATLREPKTKGSLTGFEKVREWADDRGNDFRDSVDRMAGRDRVAFSSDSAFDRMMTFTTNPFLAESPQTLTEIRPLFLYQSIPDSNPFYRGGSGLFYGLQGRLAFTERFSLVLHKLGGVTMNAGNGALISSDTGFSEIWLGPKFVFWRDPDDLTIASAGMIFQLPIGGGGVFQDTGTLSLTPYVSFARKIFGNSWGSWFLMNVTGYSFSTSNARSDYLYNTANISLDVGDRNWLFPFLEMSWFHYTNTATTNPGFNFEGRDLANYGAPVRNRDFLSIAPGVRFKISEAFQFGIAAEIPLLGTRDLHQFRLGVDFVWRF